MQGPVYICNMHIFATSMFILVISKDSLVWPVIAHLSWDDHGHKYGQLQTWGALAVGRGQPPFTTKPPRIERIER